MPHAQEREDIPVSHSQPGDVNRADIVNAAAPHLVGVVVLAHGGHDLAPETGGLGGDAVEVCDPCGTHHSVLCIERRGGPSSGAGSSHACMSGRVGKLA